MKVRALMNFATTGGGFEADEVYEMPEKAARAFVASGHMVAVEAVKAAPKKTAAKKAAARKTVAVVETAATDL